MKAQFILILVFLLITDIDAQNSKGLPFHNWALTPPMGWNSWDCFGPSVIEDEVKENADYMSANLKQFGWEYIVVDIRWYVDNQTTGHYNTYENSTFIYDEYGRYMPSPARFPSAANGAGFKPLADYVHNLGLKFGIHIMRGIPKEAVHKKLPIKGSTKTAADIYSTAYECTWLQDNYTVLIGKEGAQSYYNSILDLYASWGVDFIKVDDLSRPYHMGEIEMLRKAIDQTGRSILLSMSPGATPIDEHEHANANANMWRTVDDFWDNWTQLNYQFGVCANWAPYITPGAWPDADMLPLGHLAIRGERGVDRMTNFSVDEQYTLMSLWSIFKSPLMFGGHLPDNDDFTNSLLTNEEVLYMNKASVNNNEWYNDDDKVAWVAEDPFNGDKFVALFNNGGNGFVSTKNLNYRSGTVSRLTDGYGEYIDIEIPEGSDQLYLIVDNGGDGISCDHADWINPIIYLADGDSILLTDLTWEYATAGWSNVAINKSISGNTLNIKGASYQNGIGTHSPSIILYQLPKNTIRFKTFAGLDLGGTSQTGGSTVEFMISTADPTKREVEVGTAIANSGRISRTLNQEGKYLEADITDAEKLYLVVTDAGDNFNYDHADWINPTIFQSNGDSLLLTSLKWVSATSGWGEVRKNLSLEGNPLTINGNIYSNGYGLNSYSTIEFDLPEGYTTFKAFCGVDDEVINTPEGVTVEFMVFTQNPTISSTVSIPVDLLKLGFTGECKVRDLWGRNDVGFFSNSDFSPDINSHGAALYRISALNRSDEIECKLTSSKENIQSGDSVNLEINVSKTGIDIPSITGWIHIYQNDSVLASIQIDSDGVALYSTKALIAGEYVFRASFGGNTNFLPTESNMVKVVVKSSSAAFRENSKEAQIWVCKIGEENYLKGLNAGDQISVYNTQGQVINNFVADSNVEILNGNGVVLVKVESKNGTSSIKAIF